MPRKRSVAGRSKAKSIENKKMLMLLKVNKRLRSLGRAGNIGKFKSKELFKFIAQNRGLKLKRSKRSKQLLVIASKLRQTTQNDRLILKKLAEVLASKAFSNIGISKIRKEAREKAIKTLEEESGKKVTEADLDKFIELANYVDKAKRGSILENVDPSDFQQLINDAKEERFYVNQWTAGLAQLANLEYIEVINNEYMRKEAQELYYKYVR